MLSFVIAATPQWVEDGKNYLGFFVVFLGAMASVWKYAIKPYLVHREAERQRDLKEAAIIRDAAIRVAMLPLEEQLRLVQTEVKKFGDKSILQGDAIHGVNLRLDAMQREQMLLHADVRAHMDAEDARQQGSN